MAKLQLVNYSIVVHIRNIGSNSKIPQHNQIRTKYVIKCNCFSKDANQVFGIKKLNQDFQAKWCFFLFVCLFLLLVFFWFVCLFVLFCFCFFVGYFLFVCLFCFWFCFVSVSLRFSVSLQNQKGNKKDGSASESLRV